MNVETKELPLARLAASPVIHNQGIANINNTQYCIIESANGPESFVTFSLAPNQTSSVTFTVTGAPTDIKGLNGTHTIQAVPQPVSLTFQGNLQGKTITVVNQSFPDQTLNIRVVLP